MTDSELKSFLDLKVERYSKTSFIDDDPIQIPHLFDDRKDREISGLLAATIAWGNRKSIIKDAHNILDMMDRAPYDFVMNHDENDITRHSGSLHRTFMAEDWAYFIRQLRRLYSQKPSLEEYFVPQEDEENMMPAIERFRTEFLSEPHRASKHVSSPLRNSSAKRLNMYLRWMVRKDSIDLGIWESISSSKLSIPLDVHTARVARKLGLLNRKSNDRKAVEELDSNIRRLDPIDPARYDFALFGLGVYEKF